MKKNSNKILLLFAITSNIPLLLMPISMLIKQFTIISFIYGIIYIFSPFIWFFFLIIYYKQLEINLEKFGLLILSIELAFFNFIILLMGIILKHNRNIFLFLMFLIIIWLIPICFWIYSLKVPKIKKINCRNI